MTQFIRELPNEVFLSILGFILLFALAPFLGIWRLRRTARLIRSTPRKKIGGCPNGLVAIQGRAEAIAGEILKSPLTNTTCLWSRARVERYERERENDPSSSFRWCTEREGASTVPFLLSDGSGTCLIDPKSNDITPHDESLWFGNSPLPADRDPPKLPPHSSGLTPHYADNVTQQFRYKEERIYQGNHLFIIGEMTAVPPPEPTYDGEDGLEEEEEDLDTDATPASKRRRNDRASDSTGAAALGDLFDRFDHEDIEKALKEGRKCSNRMLVNVRLLSAQPPEAMLKMFDQGSKALVVLGGLGLSVAAFLVYLRLGLEGRIP
jgi:hypothetical protein